MIVWLPAGKTAKKEKMKKAVLPALVATLIAIVFFLAGVGITVYELKKPPPGADCGSVKSMSMKLMAEHLGFLATSIDDKNRVYMTFINGKTGDWAMMHVYSRAKKACLFMRGYNWQFVLVRRIKKPPTSALPVTR